ncbi:MAG: hypothetical protein KJ645_10945 [Planctomycetes bacterium]|nr:hypothetical protein [Planctomycetota bacterium]
MHSIILIGKKRSLLKSFIFERIGKQCRILEYPSLLDLYPHILTEQPLVLLFDGAEVSENELGVIEVLRRTFPPLKTLGLFPEDRRSLAAKAIVHGMDAYLLEPFYMEELERFFFNAYQNAKREIDHSVEIRMKSLALFIQGLAPEINNRLTPILASLQMLLDQKTDFMDDQEREEHFRRMQKEAVRIGRTVAELEDFAKPRRPKKNRVSLNAVVEMAITDACKNSRNQVSVEYREPIPRDQVLIDPDQISSALASMIRILKENADEETGRITFTASVTKAEGIRIIIEGKNTLSLGEEIHHAFIPLYLRNIVRFGHEIGLASAYGLIHAHGGTLNIETLSLGSRFLIILPQEETI